MGEPVWCVQRQRESYSYTELLLVTKGAKENQPDQVHFSGSLWPEVISVLGSRGRRAWSRLPFADASSFRQLAAALLISTRASVLFCNLLTFCTSVSNLEIPMFLSSKFKSSNRCRCQNQNSFFLSPAIRKASSCKWMAGSSKALRRSMAGFIGTEFAYSWV